MSKIYLIEKHQGAFDDYCVEYVKAFKNEDKGNTFLNECSKDMKVLLKKLKRFNDRYRKELFALDSGEKELDVEQYTEWSEKVKKRRAKLFSTFKHETIDMIIEPVDYIIKEIELI